MSAHDNLLAVMQSQDDQDWEAAKAWWREETEQGKLELWFYMQREFKDTRQELMSRLAVLTYTRLFRELSDPLGPEGIARRDAGGGKT